MSLGQLYREDRSVLSRVQQCRSCFWLAGGHTRLFSKPFTLFWTSKQWMLISLYLLCEYRNYFAYALHQRGKFGLLFVYPMIMVHIQIVAFWNSILFKNQIVICIVPQYLNYWTYLDKFQVKIPKIFLVQTYLYIFCLHHIRAVNRRRSYHRVTVRLTTFFISYKYSNWNEEKTRRRRWFVLLKINVQN